MRFLPTTLFKVVVANHDFPRDFQVTGGTEYVCHLLDSNNEVSIISPLVIDMRLRQGKIRVLRFPPHPSHYMGTIGLDGQTEQCSRCMIKADEEPVQHECPLQESK